MKYKLDLPAEATFKGPALLWKRALAFALDLVILDFVIGSPFRSAIARLIPQGDAVADYSYFMSHPDITALLSLALVTFGFLALLYFSILEYKTGQTIGKMFMNIKMESTTGEFTFFQCVTRSIYFIMLFPFALLWLADPIFMLFTKDKRRLSEILSGTRTVEVFYLNEV